MLSMYQAKSVVRILNVILMLLFMLSVSPVRGSEPGSEGKYKMIIVLAKIEQPDLKKKFEEAVVSELKSKGYEAVASVSVLTDDDLENMETLIDKIEALGIDAVLAFSVRDVENRVTKTPAIRASVGVPVRIGFVHAYVGSSVPLGGGPKQEKIVHMTAGLYTDKTSTEPAFTMELSGNLANGYDELINDFAKKSVKSLEKKDLL